MNTNVSIPCCSRQNANISTNIFRLTIMIFAQYETNSQQGFPAWFPALNYIAKAFTFLHSPAPLNFKQCSQRSPVLLGSKC